MRSMVEGARRRDDRFATNTLTRPLHRYAVPLPRFAGEESAAASHTFDQLRGEPKRVLGVTPLHSAEVTLD